MLDILKRGDCNPTYEKGNFNCDITGNCNCISPPLFYIMVFTILIPEISITKKESKKIKSLELNNEENALYVP